jgi:hypothetical protein
MEISEVYTAIKIGDTATIESYLESLNLLDDINQRKFKIVENLIAHAVKENQLDIVKLLVSNYGDPNNVNFNNWLMKFAHEYGSLALIDYLSPPPIKDEENNNNKDSLQC